MINNALIFWEPFKGYFVRINFTDYHLQNGEIVFYNEDGNTLNVRLDYGCSFFIPIRDAEFKVRKKVDFTRNEVFVKKFARKSKYDEPNSVAFYVPMKSVNLKVGNEYEVKGETFVTTYKKVTFNADYFRTFCNQSHPQMETFDNKILSVAMYVNTRYSDEFQRYADLSDDIFKTCGRRIDSNTIKELLKHYDIVKKV